MYTKKNLGEDLQTILKKPFNILKIARWAEHIYAARNKEISPELDDIIMMLSFMEHGPEFEYTEKELKLLAEELISSP